MPVFQTFADYDKWRRRQLLQRLQKLQNLPLPMNTVVNLAAKAGDPLIKYGQLSRGLQDGISRDSFPSDAISAGLQKGIDTTEGDFRDNLSAAFRKILEDAADQTTGGKGKGKDKGTPPKGGGKDKDKGKDGGGQGPGGREESGGAYGGDLVMAEHDGAFYTKTLVQLTGLGATIPPDLALDEYTLSVWLRVQSDVSSTTRVTHGAPGTRHQTFFWNANGSMQFNGYNERGTLYALDNTGTTDLLTNGQLHHLMVSVIRAAPDKVQIWLDGALVSDQEFAGSFDPLGEEVEWVIGGAANGTNMMASGMELGGVWQGQEYVADPVGVFIEAAGANPTPLTGGVDGTGFTGNAPLIYFNEIADWNSGTNQGTGGAFTVQAGTLIEATVP